MKIETLNMIPASEAAAWFEQCCAATCWIESMVAARPYSDIQHIETQAAIAWSTCDKTDVLEAFTAHPMIGDVDSLRKKFANTKSIAAGEQAGTSQASEATLLELKKANQTYLDKHGFIFIICATGLSADAMLDALNERLPHTTDEEIQLAAHEQLKITLLRINKAIDVE
jgi:2-oxo-4-hydroxy-4-carboxy-5-ureidoimidazoline decarboxylase